MVVEEDRWEVGGDVSVWAVRQRIAAPTSPSSFHRSVQFMRVIMFSPRVSV